MAGLRSPAGTRVGRIRLGAFLQQQDHKDREIHGAAGESIWTIRNRDQIIAREMGWTQLLEANDWTRGSRRLA